MKSKYILQIAGALLMFLSLPVVLNAQRFEIIPSAGYQTSARIKGTEGYFRINDGLNYGIAANFGSNQGYRIELSYGRTGSSLTQTVDNVTEAKCDLSVNYFSLGGVVQINPENVLVPFGKISLGSVFYKPLDSDMDKENVMHFSFASGVKVNLNDHFGVRFQATLHLPIFYEGMMFEEAALQPDETMKTKVGGVQGDLTAGLAFRF